MAIASSLALKGTDRLPVAIIGDGDYMIADALDVEAAVRAAHAAFPAWAATLPVERKSCLRRAAAVLREHAGPLAQLDSLNNGNPMSALVVPSSTSSLLAQLWASNSVGQARAVARPAGGFFTNRFAIRCSKKTSVCCQKSIRAAFQPTRKRR